MTLRDWRCLHHMLIIYGLIFTIAPISSATTLDSAPIPDLCASIICPPESELRCPEDSSIRENLKPVDLFNSNTVNSQLVGSVTTESQVLDVVRSLESNWTIEKDELYAQCCLAEKCICKTCYIPDCNTESDEVVVELMPESMDTPGQCCGQYECMLVPNCTKEVDTKYYWLETCRRCHCTGGSKICQQSCDEIDEGEGEDTNAFCESKSLNSFFKEGETWKDGCYECECVKGEQKCTIPFCGNVNCPTERQVQLKNTCCPVCWPKGSPMPHEKGYGKDEEVVNPIAIMPHSSSTNVTKTELVILPSSTTTPIPTPNPTPTPTPCPSIPPSTRSFTHQDYPDVVEMPQAEEDSYFKIIVGVLVLSLLANICQLIYIQYLKVKQRSYRPVSIFDDKA